MSRATFWCLYAVVALVVAIASWTFAQGAIDDAQPKAKAYADCVSVNGMTHCEGR